MPARMVAGDREAFPFATILHIAALTGGRGFQKPSKPRSQAVGNWDSPPSGNR
jgi:hypothetical protein